VQVGRNKNKTRRS